MSSLDETGFDPCSCGAKPYVSDNDKGTVHVMCLSSGKHEDYPSVASHSIAATQAGWNAMVRVMAGRSLSVITPELVGVARASLHESNLSPALAQVLDHIIEAWFDNPYDEGAEDGKRSEGDPDRSE